MPEKFRPSTTVRDKATGRNKSEHFYLKSTPKQELLDYLDKHNAIPKIKVKARKELIRRGHAC